MLTSKLFSSNRRLNDCEVLDSAHVLLGDRGEHVKLIQRALFLIDRASITEAEVNESVYGESTAAAVLDYKTARSIINPAYQSTPDNIVGKMTIRRLDDDMRDVEAVPAPEPSGAGLRPFFGRFV